MNTGIDIEFYEVEKPEEVKNGRLFIDIEGKNYIEFEGSWIEAFRTIKAIHATEVDSEEKYTLVNCSIRQTIGSTCRFVINELYKGDHIGKVTEEACIEAEAYISGLTNWINHPRIGHELGTETKVIAKDEFKCSFSVSNNLSLELSEFCRLNFSRKETILRNLSQVRFSCTTPISRFEMYRNVIAFLELLFLFTDRLPELCDLKLSFSNGKTIEYSGLKKKADPPENDALLTFDKIEPHFESMITIFFQNRNKFIQVLDLLIASIKNSTAEISFLNITTAFEVFHKEFLEADNATLKKSLFDELKADGLVKTENKKWNQVLRYFHLFKLTEPIDYFKQNFMNSKKTIALLRASRNYYTHYTETTEEIWTPNRLIFANKGLGQLLKAVILLELKMPSDLIDDLLKCRAAYIYQDFESNDYSVQYVKGAKGVEEE